MIKLCSIHSKLCTHPYVKLINAGSVNSGLFAQLIAQWTSAVLVQNGGLAGVQRSLGRFDHLKQID